MLEHEQFEELSALAAIGQLSAGELRELLAHLKQCDTCKQTHDDFAFILDQLPVADPPDVSEDSRSMLDDSHRRKFLTRASADGMSFSPAALGSTWSRNGKLFIFKARHLLAVATVAACLAISVVVPTAILMRSRGVARGMQVTPISPTAPLAPSELSADNSAASMRDVLQESQRQVQALKQQLVVATAQKKLAEVESQQLNRKLTDLLTIADRNAETYSGASSQLERLRNERAEFLAALVEKQNKLEELTDQMAADKAGVEREQQLTTAAQDVRELMGARNLHIIDVYDFDARQKRDKSFGRVFYAAGKSLIFYAFDLGPKGAAAKVSFQAWGQAEGRTASARNLGIFHVEDRSQKTWVLRVDDPQMLTSIDSVFVTVEPLQGADKPSGKKLLYAYLGAPSNHP